MNHLASNIYTYLHDFTTICTPGAEPSDEPTFARRPLLVHKDDVNETTVALSQLCKDYVRCYSGKAKALLSNTLPEKEAKRTVYPVMDILVTLASVKASLARHPGRAPGPVVINTEWIQKLLELSLTPDKSLTYRLLKTKVYSAYYDANKKFLADELSRKENKSASFDIAATSTGFTVSMNMQHKHLSHTHSQDFVFAELSAEDVRTWTVGKELSSVTKQASEMIHFVIKSLSKLADGKLFADEVHVMEERERAMRFFKRMTSEERELVRNHFHIFNSL